MTKTVLHGMFRLRFVTSISHKKFRKIANRGKLKPWKGFIIVVVIALSTCP
jgi:hypothetical protein